MTKWTRAEVVVEEGLPTEGGVPICGSVLSKAFSLKRWWWVAWGIFGWTAIVGAAEGIRPVVGVGATREEVVDAYGWPNGQSKMGEREVFTYPQGRVVLRNGLVERMDFSPNVAWPKPRPRPPAATASTAKPAPMQPVKVEPLDVWLTDFDEARAEARRQAKDVLVLFTGTDWSPPAKRFQQEVALAPEFLRTVQESYVLLRLDFPRSTTVQPLETRAKNEVWRERFAVTEYPTLLVLNSNGDELARVDLAKPRVETTQVQQVLAAIEEARPKPKAIAEWSGGEAPASEEREGTKRKIYWWGSGVLAAVMLLGWWWRRRSAGTETAKPAGPAATTMPTPADVASWSQERVRDVVAALFLHEGARVKVRRTESGAELAVLAREGDQPKALVRCQAAAAGLAGKTSVSALLGTAVAERVDEAWYVSAGGFTPEARRFAGEHRMVLMSGEDLLERMRKVPPLTLMRMLGEAGE